MMDKEITYHFTLKNGETRSHTVTFGNPAEPYDSSAHPPPEWTRLSFHQCAGCRWEASEYCPVALHLQKPVLLLNTLPSHEQVEVNVDTAERRYSKTTSVQEGLSGLFGLVMARSGCPAFDVFRGLAWFHLPFSSFEETLFRVMSGHLLRQYIVQGHLQSEAEIIRDILSIYESIALVNQGIVTRLKEGVALQCDSPFNAVTILDSLGGMVSMSVEDGWEELKKSFA